MSDNIKHMILPRKIQETKAIRELWIAEENSEEILRRDECQVPNGTLLKPKLHLAKQRLDKKRLLKLMTGRKKVPDKQGKKGRPKRPKQCDVLYDALFDNSKERIIGLISDGIRELHKNAKNLLDDVEVLLEHNKFTSSDFLLFTAAEELSQIYILIDIKKKPRLYSRELKKL